MKGREQMNRREFGLGASVLLASTCALPSIVGAQEVDGTMVVALGSGGVRTLDPHKPIQNADNWPISHLYERLVRMPAGRFPQDINELEPGLAVSWSRSDDARTWTFKLRPDVEFHNGYGVMTADDVVDSFNRGRDADRVGIDNAVLAGIESVTADGPMTVVFRLASPDPLFPIGSLTDVPASIVSSRAIAELGEDGLQTVSAGTGPFILQTLHTNPSDGVTLARFDDFWGTTPKVQAVQFKYISDTTARSFAVIAGDAHMVEGVRAPGWVPSIQQRQSNLLFDVVLPGSQFCIHVNTEAAPFDDVRVRRALFYAIDRAEIANAMAPFGSVLYGLNPPSNPGAFSQETVPDSIRYAYDPEKAKSLLAEAGLADGFTFRNYTSQREDYSAVMLMVQDQLRRVGIVMDLQIKDHTTFHADQRTATNILSQTSRPFPPVPTIIFDFWLHSSTTVRSDGTGGANFSRYGAAVPGIDDLLEQAKAEPDLERRFEITRAMEKKVLEDAVLLPVLTNGFLMVRNPSLSLEHEVVSGYSYWNLSGATINA